MSTASDIVAFAFPGLGTEPGEAEARWLARFEAAMRPALDPASAVAGTDLSAGVTPQGFAALSPLDKQRFTYAFSLGVHASLAGLGIAPGVVAGHSLGIYAALAAAGAVSARDGLALVDTAYALASAAVPADAWGLAAVAGLTGAEVDGICAACGSARRVITNAEASVVVAGRVADVDAVLAAATEAGAARVAWLDRGVPYHHPGALADAGAAFRAALDDLAWVDAAIPVISSLDGSVLRNAGDLKDLTATNLWSPIDWSRAVAAISGAGVRVVVECGPGMTLTRIGRFLDEGLEWRPLRRLAKEAP